MTKGHLFSKRDFADQEKLILVALNEKPQNKQEIKDIIKRLAMRYGIAVFLDETEEVEEFLKIEDALSYLIQENMVNVDDNDAYFLTAKGEVEAQKYSKGILTFFTILHGLAHPFVSPILSLIIHLFLGTIKILGFFLIGSISLLGDGLDSTMDGISSIIVGLSMKIQKEKQATYLLLILMLITGLGIIFQGFDRILNPEALNEGTLAIIIAIVSILLCGLLYFYQRFAGYKNRNLAILAQSEDSKNHVLNSILVLSVIIGNIFNIFILDGFVGCFIGFIILQGAYEIFKDLKAQSQGEEIDYEKYKLGVWKRYNKLQNKVLDLWILNMVRKEINTLSSLEKYFDQLFQPIIVSNKGDKQHIWGSPQQKEHLAERVQGLIELNLLREQDQFLHLTENGVLKLQDEIKKMDKRKTSHQRRHDKKIAKLLE